MVAGVGILGALAARKAGLLHFQDSMLVALSMDGTL